MSFDPAKYLAEVSQAGSPQDNPPAPALDSNEPFDPAQYLKEEKFGTLGQEAITALEGAGSSATFGASTALERAAGVPAEDIRSRREVNPGIHAAGEFAGLAAPALIEAVTGGAATPGIAAGEAAAESAFNPLSAQSVMSHFGERVARATGLGEAGSGIVSQVARAAVKGAVETGLFQSGDEISKMLSADPNQSLQSAIANVGLASALGGGISGSLGAVSPLWKATAETKLGKTVADFRSRMIEHLNGGVGEPAIAEEAGALPQAAAEEEPASQESIFAPGPFKNFPPPPGSSAFKEPRALPQAAAEEEPASQESIFAPGPFKNFPPPPGSSAFKEPAAPSLKTETIEPPEPTAAPTTLSTGAKLADLLVKQGVLKKLTAEGLGASIGAGLGKMTGVGGGLGALIGEHALSPFFNSILPALVKPILSSANNAEGLKGAVSYGLAVIKGESLISKAAAALFNPGSEVLSSLAATKAETDKLDKRISAIEENPEAYMAASNPVGHYLPDHAIAMGTTAATAVQYLSAQKPRPIKSSPLDKEHEPDDLAKYQYERTLQIAQSPLSILQHIKEGTLTTKDVIDFRSLYPSLYSNLSQKIMSQMTEHVSKDGTVPYHTRIGLSLFLGNPLDSSLSPQSIQAAQMAFSRAPRQSQSAEPAAKPKRGTASLSKAPNLLFTPGQARQASRSNDRN